ncbi:aminoacyl-tRNA hydrolase [Candidatus Collierbacteria bacterium RIFOXYD1_FULL_40_9]|uniref:Peptidyl-tRNA hydrolase n=1 Tax=Candidatus Collierbacteria bacterium RIFOXYD1_FULL_40_9 TaxID=1817731 RepID=A0A1F5FWT1_9BACT|nr:MAG: aminoacyl-tRNA hydrolase [Candidatus Collierbacteria bacterium RIFOXYD1_FULL_40_9]
MKIVVGLGNIGDKYRRTRHNVGFRIVEKLAGGESFREDKSQEAYICRKGSVLLVKPTTFMNDSGRAVRKIMDFYKINAEDLILVHDDLDIELGDYKIQKGKGPKVHNGVSSVESTVQTNDFWRLRIGVDGRAQNRFDESGADYVLSNFSTDEEDALEDVIEESCDELLVTLGL